MAAIRVYIVKKYGKDVAAYADKLNDELIESVNSVKDVTTNNLTKAIESEKTEQWCVGGRNMLFDAKKNNVALLLLETSVRVRMHHVVHDKETIAKCIADLKVLSKTAQA
ncbi:unnamed protein product [Lampetra fluviatilis]